MQIYPHQIGPHNTWFRPDNGDYFMYGPSQTMHKPLHKVTKKKGPQCVNCTYTITVKAIKGMIHE
jgi:hypothetical protein